MFYPGKHSYFFSLALLAFGAGVPRLSASTLVISVSGQFGAGVTADQLASADATWALSFDVDSSPVAANTDVFSFDAPFSDFSYLLNGSAVAVSPESIRFFTSDDGGLFTVFFGPETGFNNGMPIPEFSFSGDQVFSGTPGSPTILPGSFPVSDALYSDAVNFDDEGASVTVIIAGAPATTVPEPSSFWLMLIAAGIIIAVGPRAWSARLSGHIPRFSAKFLTRRITWIVVAISFVVFAPAGARGQTFAFTQISYPQSAGTYVTGVNDSNAVVGYYLEYVGNTNPDGDYFDHGFVYQNGVYTPLGGPVAGQQTMLLAINNSGQILLEQTGVNFTQFFLYSVGRGFTPIGLKGTITATGHAITLSSITGLNDSGQVVGIYSGHGVFGAPALGTPGTTTQPTSSGSYTQFDCPAADNGLASVGAINVSESITGSCGGINIAGTGLVRPIGFIDTGSTITTFFEPIPFSPASFNLQDYNSLGIGINNSGIISGAYQFAEAGETMLPFKGFLYDGSTFTLVVPPDASGSQATGSNNEGVVVGDYFSPSDGSNYGFIAFSGASRPGKLMGSCGCSTPGQPTVGAPPVSSAQPMNSPGPPGGSGGPVTVSSGNMFEQYTDYTTAGQNPLAFTRSYNSQGNTAPMATFAISLGVNWRSNYDRYLNTASVTSVTAERADGQQLTFTLNGGVWTSDSDVDVTLANSGAIWTLTDTDDTVETYMALSAAEAQLRSIKARSGYTQTFAYNGSQQLLSVTDSYGRTLGFSYGGGLLQSVTTPDNTTLTYGYTAAGSGNLLTSATYSTTPAATIKYLYESGSLPFALTGIMDENGNRYATWTYDTNVRALTSQLGTGASLTTMVYNGDGSRTVTNALGVTDTYKFTTLQGVPKVTEIDRAATATTAAATELFTYDVNGYTASQTDWKGNLTAYVNDVRGQPTTVNEAVGSAVARTTIISYDPTLVHLPKQIVTPGLTTSFTYDGSGELLTRTSTDTTTSTAPYATGGQSRTTTNSWSNFLLASTATPNGNTTAFAYDGSGALVKITNALNQVTNITVHMGGGLPLTAVDPNGLPTTLSYDARQRLLTGTISTSAGPLTTTNTYDAAGNLIKTTLPDGSALTNTYDTAHRLTTITDLFHQNVAYTLDALGDRTKTNLTAVGNRIQRQHSDSFDALGRTLQDIGGVGQTTSMGYDANGNAITVTDPLGRVTSRTFDALNRLGQATDPNGGITATTYDSHDRVLSVTDPNGNTTAYVYDGFGDLIQQTSPDSGVTVYRFDADGNLTQKVDAAGNVAIKAFDALDRILTTTYPADATLNIAYTYDQTGHGFGVGRLTSLTDAAGTLSRSYDERGNVLSETRVTGSTTLKTVYTYDPASRVASIRYPSGWTISQTRDVMGRIFQLPLTAPGGASAGNAISNATYKPFGPLYTLSFGNGVNESRNFDLDYRVTNLAAAGTRPVENLTYSYDADNNVTGIADAVTPANSQSFLSYDVLNRLATAYSSIYGFLGWTYDNVGNRLTQSLFSNVTATYDYAAGTNRLASITTGGVTAPITYTATGNITSIPPAPGAPTAALTYSAANRLASVTGTPVAISAMKYDAFGQRFSKTDPGAYPILYIYDRSGHLLEEADGHGLQIDYIYLSGRPVAEITGGNVYYLHDDSLGTPQFVTDSGQNVAWSTTYQPFGTTAIPVGSISQNLRFPGQYADGETGFDYNLNRDYMPGFGRYPESDPIGLAGGSNSYLYANADPRTFVDSAGLLGVISNQNPINWYPPSAQVWSGSSLTGVDENLVLININGQWLPAYTTFNPNKFNCHGFIFTHGQVTVDPKDVPVYLSALGFSPLQGGSAIQVGDIILFLDSMGIAEHSAIVVSVGANVTDPLDPSVIIVEKQDVNGPIAKLPITSDKYGGLRPIVERQR